MKPKFKGGTRIQLEHDEAGVKMLDISIDSKALIEHASDDTIHVIGVLARHLSETLHKMQGQPTPTKPGFWFARYKGESDWACMEVCLVNGKLRADCFAMDECEFHSEIIMPKAGVE